MANEPRSLLVDDILASAARALASLKGTPVRFEAPEVLSDEKRRNLIVRARAVPDAGRAQSVIIKATRSTAYDPYADTAFESSGLVREWVATAYLASRAPGRGHGASFLTGDVAQGMVVCEDLGAHVRSLVDPLLNGSAEAAERVLLCYAQALGRLHGDTVGCANAHAQTLKSVFGAHGSVAPSGRNFARLAARVEKRMGKSLPAGELAQIADRLGNPGAWQCLVHGDPCPDNALLVAGQVRLIDFEFTRPGHALLDAIYWRIGFPTCWCAGRIPPEVAARIEAAYRAEVGRAMPFALDDRVYDIECAYMTVAWLLFALDWRYEEAVREDAQWGVASLRSRLLWYLEACIDATGKARSCPGSMRPPPFGLRTCTDVGRGATRSPYTPQSLTRREGAGTVETPGDDGVRPRAPAIEAILAIDARRRHEAACPGPVRIADQGAATAPRATAEQASVQPRECRAQLRGQIREVGRRLRQALPRAGLRLPDPASIRRRV